MPPYYVYIGPPPTLLDGLREDSESLFQKCCAIVQRIFHEQWLATLGDKFAAEQIEHPGTPPAEVEASVRAKLQPCRVALREKQRELIRELEQSRALRDAAIHAYVEALPSAAA